MDAKTDVEKITKDTLSHGGVLALLYFDLHAGSKDVVAQLGTSLVQKLLNEEGVVYALGEIDEPIESDGMLSASVEVKLLVKSFPSLAKICGNHSPFSVELKKPDEIRLTVDQAHDMLMGISTNNFEFKKLILEKVYKPEDIEKYRRALEKRLELGQKLMDKKDK